MNEALSWTACSVPIPRAVRPVPNQVPAHRQTLDHAGVALASPFHRIRTADDVLSLPVGRFRGEGTRHPSVGIAGRKPGVLMASPIR